MSSSIMLNGSCSFYDTSEYYGSVGKYPRIYVDNLVEYMPELNLGHE